MSSNESYSEPMEQINFTSDICKLGEELVDRPFSDLLELKDKLGSKVYDEAVFGKKMKSKKEDSEKYKRENKNRPVQMSSKKPVPMLSISGFEKIKKVKEKAAPKPRDPRFDSKFNKSDSLRGNFEYKFQQRTEELAKLVEERNSATDPEEKAKIKFLMQRLENQNLEYNKTKVKNQKLQQKKLEIRKTRAEGKTPYFMSKREQDAQDLVEKYLELKSTGKLEKHLEKRRKKNASKNRKRLNIDN